MAESDAKVCPKETRQCVVQFLALELELQVQMQILQVQTSKLPTNSQVLRCYMFHQREGLTFNRTRHENEKIVLKQIIPFYSKANIPTRATIISGSKSKDHCSERCKWVLNAVWNWVVTSWMLPGLRNITRTYYKLLRLIGNRYQVSGREGKKQTVTVSDGWLFEFSINFVTI